MPRPWDYIYDSLEDEHSPIPPMQSDRHVDENCHCPGCSCPNIAVTVTADEVPVCAECQVYILTRDGYVYCKRMGLGVYCHVCRSCIKWNPDADGYFHYYGWCGCGLNWASDGKHSFYYMD